MNQAYEKYLRKWFYNLQFFVKMWFKCFQIAQIKKFLNKRFIKVA